MSFFSSRARRRLAAGSLSMATLPLLLVACGTKSDTAQVASLNGAASSSATGDSTSTSLSTGQVQQAMLDFASCMRDNGVNMPDPTFDASGNPQGGFIGRDSGIDPRSTEFQTAQQACGDNLQGITLGRGPAGRFDRTAIQDGFNSFTACLRDDGLQVDDITLGDGPGADGPGGPPPGASSGGATGPNDSTTTTGGSGASGSTGSGGFNGAPGGPPSDRQGGPGGPGGAGFDPTARLIERLGLDTTDPAVTAAVTTCQPKLEAAFTPPGASTTTSESS
jgi:hypothetical protein